MEATRLHAQLVRALEGFRRTDGGFPTSVRGRSEVEPTAVSTLVLRAPSASRWLASHQRADGGLDEADGRPAGTASVALAALALARPDAARDARAFAVRTRGLPPPDAIDQSRRAWAWTSDTRSLVEPTSWVLTATKVLDADDRATRNEAIRLLRGRVCAGGGWNYGNPAHLDADLPAYAQTTAVALIALQGEASALIDPGMRFLRRNWRLEPGGLTVAQALLVFRLYGIRDEAAAATRALAAISRRGSFSRMPLAMAWAALATGPEQALNPLRPRG